MGLRDLLKKKDKDEGGSADDTPEFTFIRSDTHTHEVIHPPSGPPGQPDGNYLGAYDGSSASKGRRSLDVFKPRSRSASASSANSTGGTSEKKRLSQRLHLSRSPSTSEAVPQDLPEIVATGPGGEPTAAEDAWEARATMLARANEKHRSRPTTPVQDMGRMQMGRPEKPVSSQSIDADIQEAIRLHEEGKLEESTRLFGRLADPNGANNPLSQVLYGLALRHGWGCSPDTAAAVSYLSAAASNAATVETMALQAGLKKGGAAKGELVLAIFELANCFRHGWGIPKDAIAAKQYYETAANLGDTDAMNEAAWCYLEGFGCKKDKFAAARYYRLAEDHGNKTLGNSWIWKDKYNPENAKKK